MTDAQTQLLGKIEGTVTHIASAMAEDRRHNADGHKTIHRALIEQKRDLYNHNSVVVGLLASHSADKKAEDERHSRLWVVVIGAIGMVAAAVGTLLGIHLGVV